MALGATTGAGLAFNAVRLSRSALMSAASLFLRSVSLAILAVIEAIALTAFDTGAFFGAAFATGLTAFAGAVAFFVVVAAFGADFFAVAIFKSYVVMSGEDFRQMRIVSKLIAKFFALFAIAKNPAFDQGCIALFCAVRLKPRCAVVRLKSHTRSVEWCNLWR